MLKRNKNQLFISGLSLIAGLMDTTTGLLLIFAPTMTLTLMNIPSESHPPELIGFIGAFVLANGSLYLWALGLGKLRTPWSILRYTWFATAWVRACVGITTGVFILKGQLIGAWATVPMTDLVIAAIQLYWIVSGKFPTDD